MEGNAGSEYLITEKGHEIADAKAAFWSRVNHAIDQWGILRPVSKAMTFRKTCECHHAMVDERLIDMTRKTSPFSKHCQWCKKRCFTPNGHNALWTIRQLQFFRLFFRQNLDMPIGSDSSTECITYKIEKEKKPTYENNKGLHFPTSPKNAQTKFIFQPVPNPRAAFFDHVEKGIQ
jgi:hypothetical protein